MTYKITTTHIQEMLEQALTFSEDVSGVYGSTTDENHQASVRKLRRAVTLANHAAAELQDEIDRCDGWE